MEGAVTTLEQYKRMFIEAMDLNDTARNRALTSEQYYHKKQLSPSEVAVLRRRGQPDVVVNRVRPAVNGTLGVLEQGQTDPRAWPRTPNDEDAADVATKTLRYIADYNDFDDLRVKAARDYLIQTAAAAIIEVDGNHRVVVEKINPEEFFYDPRSKREDFKDARYMGVAKWVYADDLAEMYPDKAKDIESAVDSGPMFVLDPSLEDRPTGKQLWVDRRRRRLMSVEIYHREQGKWLKCVFHTGGILEQGVSSYNDSDGKPANPIIAQSCYVDDENVRYGVVFDMIDIQDEVNKRRSKALHLLTMRQVRVGYGAGAVGSDGKPDPGSIRDELAKPDGVLLGDAGEVEILPTNDMQAGNFQMMLEAKGEMERHAPNPALMGRQEGAQSGRALMARQEAGLAELGIVFAGIETWERRVYRQMWNTAKQYWTAPDYIRVTDDEGSPQFIGINQPKMGPATVVMGQDGRPALMPTVLGYENALAEMDVDITLDSVPDTANLQQEQFQVLADLAKLYGPQEVPFDDMLMLSSISDKQKIIERRKQRSEQQGQMGQVAAQMQMAEGAAKIDNIKSQTVKNLAQAHAAVQPPEDQTYDHQMQAIDAMQRGEELRTDAFRAATERYEATKPEPRAANE